MTNPVELVLLAAGVTAPEIAVSILAEFVAVRRNAVMK
jgi:xanthine/CO dehydrogenase XdhC/CoxF family maturation factor